MSNITGATPVYLERGAKHVFVGAVEWPGWCRSGKTDQSALQALLDSGSRYARVAQAAGLVFSLPTGLVDLVVVEELPGTSTTDFGAPEAFLAGDTRQIEPAELARLQAILDATWDALKTATVATTGKELSKGPRGGGRDLDAVVRHVLDSTQSYLRRLAWKWDVPPSGDLLARIEQMQQASRQALTDAAQGKLPSSGPRGGQIWTARAFVRRLAWHILDHIWEIEDRRIG